MRLGQRFPSDDEELVRRCQAGEPVFPLLVDRYKDRVYNLAYRVVGQREEAEDLTQETFLRVFRGLGGFRTGERFSPWIYRIATNLCVDLLRRRRGGTVSLDAPGFEGGAPRQVADVSALPDERIELGELGRECQLAVAALPTRYRAIVVLRHLEDFSYEEIATITGLPLGTVKTRLFRAREILRVRLAHLQPGRAARAAAQAAAREAALAAKERGEPDGQPVRGDL